MLLSREKYRSIYIRNLNYRAGNIRHIYSYLSIDGQCVHNIDFTQTLEMHVIANIPTKQSH